MEMKSNDGTVQQIKRPKKVLLPCNLRFLVDPIVASIKPQITMGIYEHHSWSTAIQEENSKQSFEMCGEFLAGQLFKNSSIAACGFGIEYMLLA